MKLSKLDGHNICILGFGREGRATYAALKAHAPRARITIADADPNLPARPDCSLMLGPGYLRDLGSFDVVIKTPGIKWRPQSGSRSQLTSATELFLDSLPTKTTVIGVTGTKGKSTTAHLISQTLKAGGRHAILAGNIGDPMLGYLDEATDSTIFVLELSSYQLEDLHTSPHIAVVTSFFPDHIDYHGTMEEYLGAKKHITKYQTARDIVFYNPDYPECREIAELSPGRHLPFTAEQFPGQVGDYRHGSASNLAAAYLVAIHCGVTPQTAVRALENAEGLPHRQQSLGTHHGIVWINDSAATTPQSTLLALDRLEDKVDTIIVGGLNRDYDFGSLGERLARSDISNIVLFPDTGKLIRAAIEAVPGLPGKRYIETSSMSEAVAFARKHTRPGRVCLLSSAAPSYNLYKNYPQRGDDFRQAVLAAD
jgi:UDP-N-acetylmuramoyl-L-alanine---L-glutamate ligase